MMSDTELIGQLEQVETVALTIWGEARGERIEGRVAVGCVIRNRVHSKRFGADPKAVCLMPWQFSCWLQHDAAHKQNYSDLIYAARSLRQDTPSPRLRECEWVAGGVLSDSLEDITRGSTHYITRALWESKPPKWAMDRTPAVSIGAHVFFNDVL